MYISPKMYFAWYIMEGDRVREQATKMSKQYQVKYLYNIS